MQDPTSLMKLLLKNRESVSFRQIFVNFGSNANKSSQVEFINGNNLSCY